MALGTMLKKCRHHLPPSWVVNPQGDDFANIWVDYPEAVNGLTTLCPSAREC